MPTTIPFGATNGITAKGTETDVSFGKLYTGGTSIFLYSQNKIKKTTITETKFGSCTTIGLAVAINSSSGIFIPGGGGNSFPLENASAGFQEEPNIIWGPSASATTPNNCEITPNIDPATKPPITVAECLNVIGYNGSFSLSAKSPIGNFGSYKPDTGVIANLSGWTLPNGIAAWNRSEQYQMQRTDWQILTVNGKGYAVGGDLLNASAISGITPTRGSSSAGWKYYSVNYTCNSRGDVSKTVTEFLIMIA